MADKGLFIEALPRDGLVTFLALVKDKALRPKRTGGWYLYLLLSDRTGELEAKAWDSPEQTASLFERDDIVKVRGTIELYNDHPQLIVQRIRRCEAGEFQEADFCPASARDPEEMFRELQGFVDSVGNKHLRALLQSVLNDPLVAAAIKVAPGGVRLHHPCRGGMLEHVTSLCNVAEKVIEHYPRLNRDWLIAGAVLHDIGKVEELGTSRRLGYTTRGQLVGHVGLGLEILDRHVSRLEAFPVEIKSMLQHLIVSHHGEIDKGALRRPAWPEAILLHYLDEVDARLEQAWRLIDQGPVGEEWTAYVPSLERALYRWHPVAEEVDIGGLPGGSDGPGKWEGIESSSAVVTAPATGNGQH